GLNLGSGQLRLHRLEPTGHSPPEGSPQRPALHRRGQTAGAAEVSAPSRSASVSVPRQLALARQAEPLQFTLGTLGPAPDARSFGLPAQGAVASSAVGKRRIRRPPVRWWQPPGPRARRRARRATWLLLTGNFRRRS